MEARNTRLNETAVSICDNLTTARPDRPISTTYKGDTARSSAISVRWLCRVARWARRRSTFHTATDLARTTDEGNYRSWRRNELQRQLTEHFDVGAIAGRNVLDFGCGSGELSMLLSAYNPRSLIGVDKSPDAIERALESTDSLSDCGTCRPRFIRNERPDQVPLESGSVDLVCCFDVVEHIPDVRAIAREWARILRPEGRVWVWWSPWRGPYGHHLESLLPLPWVHLVLRERTLFAACTELYDASDFVPRKWDRDPATGRKKPNKWQDTRSFYPFLNRLSRVEFERIIRGSGMTIARRETHGFSGSWMRRATRALLPTPFLGECFVSFYIYDLVPSKPTASGGVQHA